MSSGTNPGPQFNERRLAAIMFTDVTGYSARTQKDETGTLQLVGADMTRMGEIAAQHGGEVLTTMGDGMLICFTSTVRAVSCALQIQAEFAARKETLPPDQCLEHRIGIHLGDIFVRDGNVAGDGVNIAARLQTKAPPGGICISQTVHDTVKGKLAMHSVFIGPQSFKNITEPIPVYHLSPEGAPGTVPPIPVAPAKGFFVKRTPDGRARLGTAGWVAIAAGLAVAAAAAALVFRPKAAATVVVAAAPTPTPVAAPTPTPAPTVAPQPATVSQPAASAPNPSVERARSFFMAADVRRPDLQIADDLLSKAVADNPTDAAAWAAYSELDSTYVRTNLDRSATRLDGAQKMAERALKLDPDLTEGLIALGLSDRLNNRNLGGAEQAFRLAMIKQPANGTLAYDLAETLRAEGKLKEAVEFFGKAGDLLGRPEGMSLEVGQTLFCMRRFQDSEASAGASLASAVTIPAVSLQALLDLTFHGNADRALLTLGRLPPARRMEDQEVFLKAYAELVAERPQVALETLKAYPGAFFTGPLFEGPKAYLSGRARARLNDSPGAKADWEEGLLEVHKRIQSAPRSPTLRQAEALLLASLGRNEEAVRDARMAANRSATDFLQPSWMEDPAIVLGQTGHDIEAIARIERLLSAPSAVWPLTPQLLRIDPVWSALREKPRFKALEGGAAAPTGGPAKAGDGAARSP